MTKFTGWVTEMFTFRENGYTVAMAFVTKIVEIQWLPLTKNGFLMDVAVDALSWQSILKSIRHFCTQYDMTSLIMIPHGVDLSKPHLVAHATHFKVAIKDWQDLTDNNDFQ